MIVIDTIGISILAVFLLFIFQKKGKMMSDYALILTIVLIGIIFIGDLWVRQGLNSFNFILEKLIGFYILPAFLTYSMLLISDDNKLKKKWWWFASFAIAFSMYIFIDFMFLTTYDHEKLSQQYKSPTIIYQFFLRGSNVFVFVVLLWFLRKLKQYRLKIVNEYSFIETIRFSWLETFTWIYFINNLLILLLSLAFSFLHVGSLQILYLTVYASIVLSLFYLCYNGIRQYSLAEYERSFKPIKTGGYSDMSKVKSKDDDSLTKYKSSSLSESDMTILFEKIEQLFENEKIYLEPQLRIQDLSEKINTASQYISQTINSKTQQSFYDLVNKYRVNHFKNLLSIPENRKFTILAIAMDSGFNSKASLNRIFKQHTGVAPRDFLNQLLPNN